jgi:hypothetical protein
MLHIAEYERLDSGLSETNSLAQNRPVEFQRLLTASDAC